MELKILSWNIWLDGNLGNIIEFVRESDADIIGMQEVIPEREPNILESLAALGYHHAFSTVMELRHDGKKMGNAVFSRFPILSHDTTALSEEPRRLADHVVLDVNGESIHIFNTHIMHTHQKQSDVQDSQIEKLLSLLPETRVLVMGDFNATPESGVVRRMSEVLISTDPSNTPTWSMYPAGCHACDPQSVYTRLDYIFASRDLATHSPAVGKSDASDHLPISVTVSI